MDCIVFHGENCENVSELIPVVDDENADGDFDGDASDIYLIWTSKFYVQVHKLKLYGL